mgnify:CR=1 FL=1
MKILWLNWKDRSHPRAGGAEIVNEELAKRLVLHGHEVIFFTGDVERVQCESTLLHCRAEEPEISRENALRSAQGRIPLAAGLTPCGQGARFTSAFEGAQSEETRDGFRVIRAGNRFSVYWKAYRYYTQHLKDWPDLVIDEMNTIPFFAKFYARQKNIMFVHQLCREIWFYQMPFPFSLIGYILEPLYLYLLSSFNFGLSSPTVVTVSESTKRDLLRFGFKEEKIHIISEGIELTPVSKLESIKYKVPTILAFGAIRPMKRTLDIIRAFEILKISRPSARLVVAGESEGSYGKKVLGAIERSPFNKDIQVLGKLSKDKKAEILSSCHLLLATSVKEGWGLVVTEANSQGTPAVVYDVDGLRDSVRHNETGIICAENVPENLAENIVKLFDNDELYEKLRHSAWEWSKEITFDKAYRQFSEIVSLQ